MNDDQIPALLGSQGKRNSYSTDFKIKVLEYYLKNGGDAVFGLKSRTADHFNIGKKTVVRIVESKEALFKAKAIKSKKSLHSVIKAASTSKVVNVSKKIPVKVAATAKSLPATKSLSISNRVTAQPHAISVKSSTNKNVSLGAVQSVSSSASTNVSSTATSASSQATDASSKAAEFCNRTPLLMNEQEEVFDLPEDPDYSILKLPIAGGTSASGVAGPALLLSTATEEVRHALIYECEVLYECKVCRSLFRSVVNFLAHKRIFCTQNYNANKNLYPKGESSCFTPHSSSVISSDYSSGGGAKTCKEPQTSSATNTGSSAFYDRLASVEQQRAADSQDCHIELECVADGASNAVFQSVRHPGTEHSQPDLKEARQVVREHECGVMAILGEDGRVVATVNLSDGTNMAASTTALPIKQTNMAASTTALPIKQEPQDTAQEEQSTSRLQCLDCSECFDDASCLDAHVRSSHSSADPTGFSCPICGGSFPSLWAVSKHLQTIHHKTKAQTEHLRQTIKNNSNKDKQTPSSASGPLDSGASAADALDGGVEVKTEPLDPPMLSSPQRDKSVECGGGGVAERWMCNVCSKLYVTHTACLAHAATHTDSSFLPKPQLVKVLISRKAFSRVLSEVSSSVWSSRTGLKNGNQDESSNLMVGSSPRLTPNMHLNESNSTLSNDTQASNSPKSRWKFNDASFSILRNNNIRAREEGIPSQSLDQRDALEKSIQRLYERHNSLAGTEPKAHEVMLQTRLTVKNLIRHPSKLNPREKESPSNDNHEQPYHPNLVQSRKRKHGIAGLPVSARITDNKSSFYKRIAQSEVIDCKAVSCDTSEKSSGSSCDEHRSCDLNKSEDNQVQKSVPDSLRPTLSNKPTTSAFANLTVLGQPPTESPAKKASKVWELYEEDWADDDDAEPLPPLNAPPNGDHVPRAATDLFEPREIRSKTPVIYSSIAECTNATNACLVSTAKTSEASAGSVGTTSKLQSIHSSDRSVFDAKECDIYSVEEPSFHNDSSPSKRKSESSVEVQDIIPSPSGNRPQPKNVSCHESVNLFDCGSVAEQELDDRYQEKYGSESTGMSLKDDSLMLEASSLGLFDTGFEECCLHSDRLEEDHTPPLSHREQSPVAGPSFR
ncbi:uncharacterized protein LOC108680352 isoform X6 [Hyalella azteca]|uniref:Uncharacterized protein LOC108680352 isoform X6 n=1 Tax=Hyalella azteca TaxID=294128 RepID=A0A8B7PH53_HYAAZ|nr:uncharacterized protein LOC108680352 isoform X6 [Hyalella azteca]